MEANPICFEVDGNGYVNLKNHLDGNIDENGYLRPMSKPGVSAFVEEAKYSGFNPKTNHQYINSKRGERNNAMALN